jgi:hypothetical protein
MRASINLKNGVVTLATGPSSNRTTEDFCLDTDGRVLQLQSSGTAFQVCNGLRSTGSTLRVHGDTIDKRHAALLACIRRESRYQRKAALQEAGDELKAAVAI